MTVPSYLSVEEAHDEIERLENLVKDRHPEGVEMFIHTDPCTPVSCRICSRTNCDIRQMAHEETIVWNLDNVLENRRHQ